MIEFLIALDTQIYLFFNGLHTPLLDEFMMLFTGRFIWVPMYVALAVLMIKTFGYRLGTLYIAAAGLAILLTDQACATYMRPFFARMRPSNPDNPLSAFATLVDGYRGGRYGFPSCHAANSFALATFVSCLLRRRGLCIFMYLWAILNSYTRLYLGVHYPGDLVVGAIIGSSIGVMCYMAVSFVSRKQRIHSRHALNRPLFVIPTDINFAGIQIKNFGFTIGDSIITIFALTVINMLLIAMD